MDDPVWILVSGSNLEPGKAVARRIGFENKSNVVGKRVGTCGSGGQ